QRRNRATTQTHRLANAYLRVFQVRRLCSRDLREVRPHLPVEQMRLQRLQRLSRGMHGQRGAAHPADRVDQKWNTGDMIQVRMRDEDMLDLLEIRQGQVSDTGARIDQHIVIDQHRGGTEGPPDASAATEHSELHHLVSKAQVPSQPAPGGWLRKWAM